MKSIVIAALLLLASPNSQLSEPQQKNHYVLPNPKLLTCKSADCSQLWSENLEPTAIYPKQVAIDMNKNCAYGLTALYDKSVPIDQIKAAIDERYQQWAILPYVWRVEPEKFAIHLATTDKQDEKHRLIPAGTKQVLYIAFGGQAACTN